MVNCYFTKIWKPLMYWHFYSSWCKDINHDQLAYIIRERLSHQTFGEHICELFQGRHKRENKLFLLQASPWWNAYQFHFVMSCDTGLWAMLIANFFPQYNLMGRLIVCLRSSGTLFNHNYSHTPWAIYRNSSFCTTSRNNTLFSLLQVTKLPHKSIQYPDVDLLTVIDPFQSASV